DIADSCDIVDGTSADCDANTVPDECQDTSADCNDNGVWDACDIADGTSEDCTENGVPDECEAIGPVILQQPVSQEVEVGELVFWGLLPRACCWNTNGARTAWTWKTTSTYSAASHRG
ncbi:MAG: hypothetical protein O7D91_19935, partial [Planctomycetota bacterium]|nr:hypothetical protein [Planctomycetota bacterium]